MIVVKITNFFVLHIDQYLYKRKLVCLCFVIKQLDFSRKYDLIYKFIVQKHILLLSLIKMMMPFCFFRKYTRIRYGIKFTKVPVSLLGCCYKMFSINSPIKNIII